jgi:hypothetical protein
VACSGDSSTVLAQNPKIVDTGKELMIFYSNDASQELVELKYSLSDSALREPILEVLIKQDKTIANIRYTPDNQRIWRVVLNDNLGKKVHFGRSLLNGEKFVPDWRNNQDIYFDESEIKELFDKAKQKTDFYYRMFEKEITVFREKRDGEYIKRKEKLKKLLD